MAILRLESGWSTPYTLECDICGHEDGEFGSFDEAVESRSEYGFHSIHEDGEWLDLCEDCWEKRQYARGRCSAADDFAGFQKRGRFTE